LRLGAVLAGMTALGVALPTLAATEGKCCDVRVGDLAGRRTAGGEPVTVTATMAARRKGCTNVRPRVTVSLAGLDADDLRIERLLSGRSLPLPVRAAGPGAVQATDLTQQGLRLCGDGQATLAYRVTFLPGAAAGRVTLSAEAGTPAGKLLGRDATVTVVRNPVAGSEPVAQPAAHASAPNAAAPTSDVDSPAATEPAPAPATVEATPARLSETVIATGLGTVVAAMVAMVGVLALRERRRRDDPQTAPPGRGGSGRPRSGSGRPRSGWVPGWRRPRRQPTLAARWSSLGGGS
jgi:hypothetical protein